MNNRYKVLLADPPWRYNARNNKNTKFGGGAGGHYDTMSIEEIKALPIKNICADNCAIFLWVTFPYLDKHIEVLKAWGFEYKTVAFTWVKTNKNNNNPFFGIGYYTKSNAEICLLGIKGKMKPISNKVSSIVMSPRQEHSRKPECIHKRIEELFGNVPRCELFSRKSVVGWDCYGMDIDNVDIKEILNNKCR